MGIVYDTREIPSGIPDLLKNLNVKTTAATLTYGDYWVGNIPAERKEAHDYVSSLMSGHLATQLYELSHGYEISFLIVEGSISEALMGSSVPRQAYLSSLVGSAIKVAPDGKQGVINVLSVDTKWDTALLLKCLDEKLMNGDTIRLPRMERRPSSDDEILVYILSSFPSIGENRARQLLKRFDGLDSIMTATEDELAEVDDIGPKTAAKLYATLHRSVKVPA